MAEERQSVSVEGEGHQVVTAMRDVIMAETVMQGKPEFIEPSLDQFKPPRFVSPRIAPQLAEAIRERRLLVLGGAHEVDKSALARHIAWYFDEMLLHERGPDEERVKVLEWQRSSDPQRLVVTLRETKTTTIFVLPQILPQDLNYDLFRIQDAASLSQHYVIASTDTPFETWKLPDSAQPFWRELPAEGLYSVEDLAEVLIQRLIEEQENLPAEWFEDELEPDRPLVGQMTIRTVAEQLKMPENIAIFVRSLCMEGKKGPLDQETVQGLVAFAQDNRRVLQQWYHTSLEPREQLLALGLGFFDGLFDDQFFAAIEQVVEKMWQRRDASLRALDYCDLDILRNFFSFVETEGYGTMIESRLSEQRRVLFEIAWNSHRRQILTALSVLVQLVKNSVGARSFDLELYGTPARRDQLRRVIGEALSDIGLISTDAVQNTLLQLAADRELGVQAVAARAMARWRSYGRDQTLFTILRDWQVQSRARGLINAILEGRKEERVFSPESYIRATVALTVSYAAQYDSPNTLSEGLCDLLKELADDRNVMVRNRFCIHTLPMVTILHHEQLRKMLHDMAEYADLVPAISVSLALAYRETPDEVLRTLNAWYDECAKSRPDSVDESETTSREHLVAIVARTYGEIRYEEGIGPLTADVAFKKLRTVLTEERHPFVRSAVVIAAGRQARRHFDKVESLLQDLVDEVTEKERDEIVRVLTDIYLEQRAEQEDGAESVQVNERSYPVWIDSARPMTEVEKAMYRWIRDADKPAAQQVGMCTLVSFARALEMTEARHIHEVREERKRAEKAAEQVVVEPVAKKGVARISFVGRFASWLATVSAVRYRLTIEGLLPEALTQHKSSRSALDFVLEKWRRAQDDELKSIAKFLRRAIGLAERFWILVVAGIAFIACWICVLCNVVPLLFD